uniref:Uncharacterized protein n=1 Tax=Anguilla anguilla TaxID=7936 RepID=A0A0E9T4W1_ANGAN
MAMTHMARKVHLVNTAFAFILMVRFGSLHSWSRNGAKVPFTRKPRIHAKCL